MNEVLRNEITTQLGFSNRIDVEGTEYYEWVITSTRPFSWILYVKNPNRSAARWLGFKRNTWPRSQVKTETGTGIGGILGRFCNRTGTSNDAERARNGLDSVLIQFDQICVLVLWVPLSSDVCVLLLNEPTNNNKAAVSEGFRRNGRELIWKPIHKSYNSTYEFDTRAYAVSFKQKFSQLNHVSLIPNSYKEKYGDFPGHEIYELTLKLKDIHHALRLVHST